MYEYLAIIIILLLIIILYDHYYDTLKFSSYNTHAIAPCKTCEKYHVHYAHDDKKSAAALLREINMRNKKLFDYLEKKYVKDLPAPSLDPTKNNRIDIIPSTEMYDLVGFGDAVASKTQNQKIGASVLGLINDDTNREYLQERIEQLVNNYNPQHIYEISPKNTGNATSYTEDKKVLVLCLRKKKPNSQGEYELHDINTMMFVVLHELAHMMNNSFGHAADFWVLFKFLLYNATEANIYKPVNYAKNPIVYCGLSLYYNPLFDMRL
jgi:hypothetical protein